MRYGEEDRESNNVEDRRGQRGPMFRLPGGGGPGGFQIRVGQGGISFTTLFIIVVVL
jgi:hypothetical protein